MIVVGIGCRNTLSRVRLILRSHFHLYLQQPARESTLAVMLSWSELVPRFWILESHLISMRLDQAGCTDHIASPRVKRSRCVSVQPAARTLSFLSKLSSDRGSSEALTSPHRPRGAEAMPGPRRRAVSRLCEWAYLPSITYDVDLR